MITLANVITSCIITGFLTLHSRWAGFIGSIVGAVIYYGWLIKYV